MKTEEVEIPSLKAEVAAFLREQTPFSPDMAIALARLGLAPRALATILFVQCPPLQSPGSPSEKRLLGLLEATDAAGHALEAGDDPRVAATIAFDAAKDIRVARGSQTGTTGQGGQ